MVVALDKTLRYRLVRGIRRGVQGHMRGSCTKIAIEKTLHYRLVRGVKCEGSETQERGHVLK